MRELSRECSQIWRGEERRKGYSAQLRFQPSFGVSNGRIGLNFSQLVKDVWGCILNGWIVDWISGLGVMADRL